MNNNKSNKHDIKPYNRGVESLPIYKEYKDYMTLFDAYRAMLDRCYNLFIFMIDGLTYCYNFCTSYFYQLRLEFIENKENYTIDKVYYMVKQLNYYRLQDVRFYDFEINPMTGVLERCIQRRVNFLAF